MMISNIGPVVRLIGLSLRRPARAAKTAASAAGGFSHLVDDGGYGVKPANARQAARWAREAAQRNAAEHEALRVAIERQAALDDADRLHARANNSLLRSVRRLVAKGARRLDGRTEPEGGNEPRPRPGTDETGPEDVADKLREIAREKGFSTQRLGKRADGKTKPEGGNEPRPRPGPRETGPEDVADKLREIAREKGFATD